MNRSRTEIQKLAKSMINDDVIVLDITSTDLDDIMIQIKAVSSKTGQLLYRTTINTGQKIPDSHLMAHGITGQEILTAPSFCEVSKDLERVINGRQWSSFNKEHKLHVMRNALPESDENDHKWSKNDADCIMLLAADFFGTTNKYGSISLTECMNKIDSKWEGNEDNENLNAKKTVLLMRHIAKQTIH